MHPNLTAVFVHPNLHILLKYIYASDTSGEQMKSTSVLLNLKGIKHPVDLFSMEKGEASKNLYGKFSPYIILVVGKIQLHLSRSSAMGRNSSQWLVSSTPRCT